MYNEQYPGWGKILDDNAELDRFQNGVWIRLLERDGRLHVMIEVDEDSTQDDLRAVIPLACRWRDRVMEYQGAWSAGGRNELLEGLSHANQHGITYARLAERINKGVEKHLKDYLVYRQEVDALHPDLIQEHEKDIFFHVYWLGMASKPSALSFAKDLLEGMNFSQQDTLDIIRNGLEGLSMGESPFTKHYPVTKYKMIEVLRTWRNGKKHKSIIKSQEV